MIKRYDLGQICLGGQGNDTIYGPGIVERKDGDYVRYEDYAAAMESIGAGGVSGQKLMKRPPISDGEIRQIALESGFTLREGGDLRRYVYDFARNLLGAGGGKEGT